MTGRTNFKAFNPGKISTMEIKNRLVRSAALENAASNGEVTDTYTGLFKAMAEGGVGMIISGIMSAVQEDALPTQVHLYDDRFKNN